MRSPVIINKFPCLGKLLLCGDGRYGEYKIYTPINNFKNIVEHTISNPLIYILKQGYFADEYLFVPLELLMDKTISLTSISRWIKASTAQKYLPYVVGYNTTLSLDLIG